MARARSVGATVIHELVDQTDYPSRDFTIADPDGNHWTFADVRRVTPVHRAVAEPTRIRRRLSKPGSLPRDFSLHTREVSAFRTAPPNLSHFSRRVDDSPTYRPKSPHMGDSEAGNPAHEIPANGAFSSPIVF